MASTIVLSFSILFLLGISGVLLQLHSGNYVYIDGPRENPVGGGSLMFSTQGFSSPQNYNSSINNSHVVGFRRRDDGQYPFYVEVDVSNTDMPPRDRASGQCVHDALTFYDGNSTDSPLLVDVCGYETPRFDTTGPEVFLTFVTNETRVYKGAEMTFRHIYADPEPYIATRYELKTLVIPPYGYALRSGTMKEPNPPAIRRTYKIISRSAFEKVVIYVNDTLMSARTNDKCEEDKVVFYNGDTAGSDIIAEICGQETPTLRSKGQYVTIYFEGIDRPGTTYKGITLSYKAGGAIAGIANGCVVVVALNIVGIVYRMMS